MNNLTKEIFDAIKNGKNVFLVGATDSGKSWFLQNEIIPFLRENNYKVCYLEDSLADSHISENCDIVIADEYETFVDKDFLEKRHPEEVPYYSGSYIKQVNNCQKTLGNARFPVVFVITRNEDVEIDYLVNKISEEYSDSLVALKMTRK